MILNRSNQIIKLPSLFLNRSFATDTDFIKSILGKRIIEHQKRVTKFRNEYGHKVIDKITVDQLFDGMRNVKSLVTETSFLDTDNNGIYFRGYPIKECCEKLSKISNSNQPLPESVFYLLLTGDLPTQDQIKEISKCLAEHSELPSHVIKMINNFPSNLHPMSQFSAAIVACSTESLFTKAYSNGVPKSTYWEYTLDDAIRIIAKLPVIASLIYRNLYRDNSSTVVIDLKKDWSENFTSMLGYENKDFTDLMRLFLTIYSDHDGGNIGSHATHLVSSTLSNPYQAFSAAINGLAGPLHDANNTDFITILTNKFSLKNEIEDDKLKEYILNQLNNGQMISSFNHAVLKTDPRYIIQYEFALKYLPDHPMLKLVSQLPEILSKTDKIKHLNPNANLLSILLLQYYGIKETNYYPVLIGISRSLGALSKIILDRGLNKRLINPDSLSTDELFKMFQFN